MDKLVKGIGVLGALLLIGCGGGGGGGGDSTGGGGSSGVADLAVTAFTAPAEVTAGADYTVTGTVTNRGGASIPATGVAIFLSPFEDVTRDGGHIGIEVHFGDLGPGDSWNFSADISIPDDMAGGSYYIGAVVPYAEGFDTNIGNNQRSQAIAISGGSVCSSDAYEADNSAGSAAILAFGEAQAHNFCEATSDWLRFSAVAGKTYGIATSQVDSATTLRLYGGNGSTLLASGTPNLDELGAQRLSWTAPASGTYYLQVTPPLGPHHAGAGSDYVITLGDQRADLAVSRLQAPSSGYLSGTLEVSDTIYNQGFAATGSFTVGLYLSSDAEVTTADTLLDSYTIDALAVGEDFYGTTLSGQLPDTSGTYYLAVIADTGNAVDEAVESNNRSAVQPITVSMPSGCGPDSFEADDSALSAKAIVAGAAAQTHNHCEDLADWLSFEASQGTPYLIRVLRSGYSTAAVELYASDGTTLLAGSSGTTTLNWTAPSNGSYYLKLVGTAGAGRDYSVSLNVNRPDLTQSLSYNGTSSPITVPAGGVLRLRNAVYNVGIAEAGAFDIGFFASLDSNIGVTDQQLGRRALTGLAVGDVSSEYYTEVYFPKNMATGTYHLAAIADATGTVTEVNENNNVSTALQVQVVAPPCVVDAYEDDDQPGMAKSVTAGVAQTRNHCDDGIDWISFTPTTSDPYVATTDNFIEVFADDGVTLVTPGGLFQAIWTASAGQTYLIKEHNIDPASTEVGSYQFGVYACPQDAYEDDDVSGDAKTLGVGQTQSRNNCEDSADWVRIEAVAGTAYTMTMSRNNIYATLYGGDAQTVLQNSDVQGQKSILKWTAPASGTYYLKLHSQSTGLNTAYTLSLN